MTRLNAARQQLDATFTLIGPDRVHPTVPGSLVMANLFLEAQAVPKLVAAASIQAGERAQVEHCDRCSVADLRATPDGVAFRWNSKALPAALNAEGATAEKLLARGYFPGSEMLTVTGLAAGSYALMMDGVKVAACTSEQLATGVDLAQLALNPDVLQGMQVEALDEQVREQQVRLRDLAVVRYTVLMAAGIDYKDDAASETYLAKCLQGPKTAPGRSAYRDGLLAKYAAGVGEEQPLKSEVAAEVAAAEKASVPRAHDVELRRL